MSFYDPPLPATPPPAPYVLGDRSPYVDPVTGTQFYNPSMTTILPHIYIDPLHGSDDHDGLTAGKPIRSRAALLGHPLIGPPGSVDAPKTVRDVTIGIIGHAGHVYLESFNFGRPTAANGYRSFHRVSWVRVGAEPVKFMCSRPAASGAFRPHASLSGVYQIDWAHNMAPPSERGLSRARVWIENKPLRRVSSPSALIAGTFCYDGYPVLGEALTVSILDYDGSDPRSSGKTVEITYQDVAIATNGGLIQGIWAYRNGYNDGSLVIYGSQGRATMRGTLQVDGTKHAGLVPAGDYHDDIYVNGIDGEYSPDGVGTCNLLGVYEDDLVGKRVTFTRCGWITDDGWQVPAGQYAVDALLVHDAKPGSGPAELVMSDCWRHNVGGTIYLDNVATATVTGFAMSGHAQRGFVTGAAAFGIARSMIGPADQWIAGTNVTARSSLFVADQALQGGGITASIAPGSIAATGCLFIGARTQDAPALDLQAGGSTLRSRNNIFAGFTTPLGLLAYADTDAPATIDSDRNALAQIRDFIRYRNASYPLARWRSVSSQDGGSAAVASYAALGVGAAGVPSSDTLDIRLNLSGLAYATLTDPLTQAEAARMASRPRTLAQAEAYLLDAPSLIPVYA